MTTHRETRLVIELGYDDDAGALTWVVLRTDADGQLQWEDDGCHPLSQASAKLWDSLAVSIALAAEDMRLGEPFPA